MTFKQENETETKERDSDEEALLEMLGLNSLEAFGEEIISNNDDSKDVFSIIQNSDLAHSYKENSICFFPKQLCVSASHIRSLTDELVWGGPKVKVDRSYERIKFLKCGKIGERRSLTRLEKFVNYHDEWRELCNGHLADCISALYNERMVLFKEKLNVKPPGGSGFAPHLDTPSLRVSFGKDGPQNFVTVMVAIDNMTISNGCLLVCKGQWSEEKHCEIIEPEENGNPDAGGRAGAIPENSAQNLTFSDVKCQGGDIVVFNGWAPHRSSPNISPFPRRAVFLTYNPAREGDFHDRYYERMEMIRNEWREKVGLEGHSKQLSKDEKSELDALATIPRI